MRGVVLGSLPGDRQMRLQSSLGFLDHDLIIHISYWHNKTSAPRLWAGGLYLFCVNVSRLSPVSGRKYQDFVPLFQSFGAKS
jgi:hypothetical protein